MAKLLNIDTYTDSRGSLSVIEKVLPFEIKRTYVIYNIKGQRGGHRHKKNIQALVCIKGSCTIANNDGQNEENFILNQPDQLLIIEPKDWHVMHSFSPEAILLVLASENYSLDDYIDEPYK